MRREPARGRRARKEKPRLRSEPGPLLLGAQGVRDEHWRRWLPGGFVAGFTLLGVAIHCFGYPGRPLWSDEASTYWTVHARFGDLLLGARTDGTPPLYFAAVFLVTRLCGSSEVALRLVSLVAGSLLVPATYAMARRIVGTRGALIAAGLVAVSPLVHYYSVEARNYALLQIETVAIVGASWSAVRSPADFRRWAILALSYAVELWSHNEAVFLLPVLPLVCLALGRAGTRVSLAGKAALASLAAFALYLPWFIVAERHAGIGIADWIVPYWESTPPAAAILRSFEVFGFGGLYPSYLSYLGTATPLRVVSIPLTVLAIGVAAVGRWRGSRDAADGPFAKGLLLGFVTLPLAGAWLFSILFEPLYLVGRYDTMVLPIFLVIFAAGLDWILSARRTLGWFAIATAGGLAAVTHATSLGQTVPYDPDVAAAQVLAREAAPGAPVVFTGLRRPVIEFYLDQARHPVNGWSFPAEVGEHPGWHSPTRMLRDPARLTSDAQRVTEMLATEVDGRRGWLLTSGRNEVDSYLTAALALRFEVDEQGTHRECGLYALRLKERKS